MAILITGGAGFVGAGLAKALVERGEEVVVFGRSAPLRTPAAEQGAITRIQGDITIWPEVLNAVQNYKTDTIFHLAAILSATAEANPWAAIDINALGTFHVLEAARLFHVKKVIFTSSIGTYAVTRDTVVTDDTAQRPPRIYGITKVFGELLGLYYQRKFGIDFRGIRFPQIIGPRVTTMGFGQYVSWLIEAAIKGEVFDIWVSEKTVLPLLYVKDAVRSLVMLFDADETRLEKRVYNLGQMMPPPSAGEVVDAVKRYYPHAVINFKPDSNVTKGFETIPKIIRGDHAAQEWGWSIHYGLEDAIKDFIEEYNTVSVVK